VGLWNYAGQTASTVEEGFEVEDQIGWHHRPTPLFLPHRLITTANLSLGPRVGGPEPKLAR